MHVVGWTRTSNNNVDAGVHMHEITLRSAGVMPQGTIVGTANLIGLLRGRKTRRCREGTRRDREGFDVRPLCEGLMSIALGQ